MPSPSAARTQTQTPSKTAARRVEEELAAAKKPAEAPSGGAHDSKAAHGSTAAARVQGDADGSSTDRAAAHEGEVAAGSGVSERSGRHQEQQQDDTAASEAAGSKTSDRRDTAHAHVRFSDQEPAQATSAPSDSLHAGQTETGQTETGQTETGQTETGQTETGQTSGQRPEDGASAAGDVPSAQDSSTVETRNCAAEAAEGAGPEDGGGGNGAGEDGIGGKEDEGDGATATLKNDAANTSCVNGDAHANGGLRDE